MANKTRTMHGKEGKTPIKVASGVYNKNPSPGLASYPADVGAGDIDVKFAETGVGDASYQKNAMRRQDPKTDLGIPKVPTSSNMNKSKNKVHGIGPTKQFKAAK